MKLISYALMMTLGAGVAHADICPAYSIDETERAELMAQVKTAPSQQAAQLISNQLWEIWATAPDKRAQELLDEGLQRRAAFDLEGAIVAFDALVDYCPDYAEGYNQRAFVLFIQQHYEAALADLDAAIERSPEHLGALAGKALTLLGLNRDVAAQTVLRDALALNPWLPERRFLKEPDGNDI
jgi:tetratricopeptide (TPR) repeat protein